MKDDKIFTLIRDESLFNNEVALKAIYVSNYYMVENFILSHGGSKEDAKDVFQDTVITFYNNVKKDQFELKSKISTYLYSVSRNIWFKKIRDDKIVINSEDFDKLKKVSSSDDIHKSIEYTEEQKLIAQLLSSAGAKCKQILTLYYFEKLRMKKIASELGYNSEQVAKNQKAKCMKKIKAAVLSSNFYLRNLKNNL